MDMHGSTPGAGFMDRVTGHDFYLELVREESAQRSARASSSRSRTDLEAALRTILDQPLARVRAATCTRPPASANGRRAAAPRTRSRCRRIGRARLALPPAPDLGQRDPGAPRQLRAAIAVGEPEPAFARPSCTGTWVTSATSPVAQVLQASTTSASGICAASRGATSPPTVAARTAA